MPAYAGGEAVEEVKRLYLDAITSARRFISIENQYFTARSLADALQERLGEPDGPEVILVLPETAGGWLDQVTMDVLRGRIIGRLKRADEYHLLRVFYPYQPGLGKDCIYLHAKLMIVDDRLVRIGSSNANGRFMGPDTEYDVIIEAQQPKGSIAAFNRKLRLQLLCEHLDCSAEQVAEAESNSNGLLAAIEALRGAGPGAGVNKNGKRAARGPQAPGYYSRAGRLQCRVASVRPGRPDAFQPCQGTQRGKSCRISVV